MDEQQNNEIVEVGPSFEEIGTDVTTLTRRLDHMIPDIIPAN
ncbi:hypothetical protein [Kitasatospora herbaricolor]